MRTYREFRPTGCDQKGLGLEDRQDWLVLPCGRNRDSSVLDESNFAIAKKILDDAGVEYGTHSFGHWACGWFEIILVSPTQTAEAAKIEDSLADYPVLCDSDYSDRVYAAACEVWRQMRLRERVEVCQRFGANVFAARRDAIPEQVELSYLADGN